MVSHYNFVVIMTEHIYFRDLPSSSISFPDRLAPGVAGICSLSKRFLSVKVQISPTRPKTIDC